ncbi:MAG TPA: alkaline phosphatase family protein [Steroidobacteraceae bacterium]|nr:alkaline phosphatase family protein [Steroidobacteraceae bacterium]
MADDPIEHIVVLMLENRSFDHILGGTPKMRAQYDLSGSNKYGRKTYNQQPGAARQVPNDPVHATSDVLVQLGGNGGIPPNGGFVSNYAQACPQLADPAEVMRFHDGGTLPAIHALANAFTVCDHWHASVPGPTWVNRLFALSGTSLGRVKMPNGIMNLNLHWYDQPTIFDRLNERSIDWKVYFGDTPLSLLFVHQWSPENAARHHHMMAFYQDAAGDAEQFPSFAFIEPAYLQPGANDAHPPHDIIGADGLVAGVYNAIRKNDKLWNSTLLLVLFDEHGGFYDHVVPPAAIPPDHHSEEYDFTRYGVRVPAILVSPYVGNGIFSELLDHTSLLKYLQDKWALNDLGDRTAKANTFKDVITAGPRSDAPVRVDSLTISVTATPAVDALNEHQSALVAMSHNLESMTDEDPNVVAARSRHLLTGPQSQIDTAVDRVDNFINQQKAAVESWIK